MSNYKPLLDDLFQFVNDEQEANDEKLHEVWQQPLTEKLLKGWSQEFSHLERTDDKRTLIAHLGENESRFREGDLLALHLGNPLDFSGPLARRLTLEEDGGDQWLLRSRDEITLDGYTVGAPCYADPDGMSLLPFYQKSLEELAVSTVGNNVVLPMLHGDIEPEFDDSDCLEGERIALEARFNAK
ncbi:hypothetical protein, partial [Variovorax sp. PCZ-1]|uniref:hypothetical protein n=1 Tax=Variovorax sp. PCZ-1 TaxID=2835533 RepID=UPI001BCF0F32